VKIWRCSAIGLAAMVVLTLSFWVTDLDLTVAALTYSAAAPHWSLGTAFPWRSLKHFGVWPGLMVGVGAVVGYAASWFKADWKAWQRPCSFVICSLALGPGLLVSGICKPLFGRPRPYEILPLGGSLPFLRPFQVGFPCQCASFVSGHAAMGFFLMTLYFVLRGWKRWVALGGGLLYGLLIGTSRILQGDHFLSDILLCGVMVFLVGASLDLVQVWRASRGSIEAGGQGSTRPDPSQRGPVS
jgi:lipid A 4'-phosphatase